MDFYRIHFLIQIINRCLKMCTVYIYNGIWILDYKCAFKLFFLKIRSEYLTGKIMKKLNEYSRILEKSHWFQMQASWKVNALWVKSFILLQNLQKALVKVWCCLFFELYNSTIQVILTLPSRWEHLYILFEDEITKSKG